MHPSMPDEYKAGNRFPADHLVGGLSLSLPCQPVIFVNGERVDFPLPTKTIRAPRIRHPKTQRRPPGQVHVFFSRFSRHLTSAMTAHGKLMDKG